MILFFDAKRVEWFIYSDLILRFPSGVFLDFIERVGKFDQKYPVFYSFLIVLYRKKEYLTDMKNKETQSCSVFNGIENSNLMW